MTKQNGFVLADVLIALMIASLLLVSILDLNHRGASHLSTARASFTANALARELSLDPAPARSGAATIGGKAYSWTVTERIEERLPSKGVELISRRIIIRIGASGQAIEHTTHRMRST